MWSDEGLRSPDFFPLHFFAQIPAVLYKILSMHSHLYQFIVKMPYHTLFFMFCQMHEI